MEKAPHFAGWHVIKLSFPFMRQLQYLVLTFVLLAVSRSFADEPVLKFTMTKVDGANATYEFLVPSNPSAEAGSLPRDAEVERQHNAGVAALSWAKRFYGAREIYMRSVELKEAPTPYYLAKFDGEVAGARQVFFAVILPSNAVLEPVEIPPGNPQ
jgi:hypothetical protein